MQLVLIICLVLCQSHLSLHYPSRILKTKSPSNIRDADHKILLNVLRGENAHRTPVWLLRQAGRYLPEFREYSDKIPFR